MTDNPYASPAAESSGDSLSTDDPHALLIASQNRRFINMIIDNIIIQVLLSGVGFAVGFMLVASQSTVRDQRLMAQRLTQDDLTMRLIDLALGLFLAWAYYVIMETVFQKTVGKFVTGTIVVTADGKRPTVSQVIGRSLARFIPLEPLSFLVGKFPVGWHDSLSGTRVIRPS